MATLETYIDGTYGKPQIKSSHADLFYVLKKKVNFADQTLDAGNADVLKVLQIPAKTRVLDSWIEVDTACSANATVDLGDGTDVDLFGNGLPLDATGRVEPALIGSATWDAGSLDPGETEAKDITIDGAALGDEVFASHNVDVSDLIVSAQVTAANTATVTLTNQKETIYTASTTWDASSLDPGETEAKSFTVTGAALGDMVEVAHGVDVADLILSGQVTATNTVTATLTNQKETIYTGTATWNAGSLDPGETEAKEVTVTGAALGDFVEIAHGVDVADLIISGQVTATNVVTVTLTNQKETIYTASTTWDASSLNDGQEVASDFTLTGVALGDFVEVSSSLDVADLILTGQVTATNIVTVQVINSTGGAINLGSATFAIRAKHAGTAVDLASATLSARVKHAGTAVNLASATLSARVKHPGTAVDLASATVQAKVLKSKGSITMGKYYSSADTIDIKATTDTADVNMSAGIIWVKALCVDESLT